MTIADISLKHKEGVLLLVAIGKLKKHEGKNLEVILKDLIDVANTTTEDIKKLLE